MRLPIEAWLVPGLTMALGLILAQSIGMDASFPWLVGIGIPLALYLVLLARRSGSHCLHMAVFMVVLGGIGLLIGARIDFGPFGLSTLTGWCSVLPALSLDAVWTKIALAPWTYGGMLVACNLGMALSSHLFGGPATGRRGLVLRFTACNAGMIMGMFLAEALMPGLETGITGTSAMAAMFLLMVSGMTAGMWAGWWSVQWLIRGWRRPGQDVDSCCL